LTVDDAIKAKLLWIGWRYRHISFPACVAVMLCVRNRVKEGNWLATLEKIEYDYSTPKPASDQRDPILQDIATAVDAVFTGERVDRWTNGGTHWIDTSCPMPTNVMLEMEKAGMARVATVAGLEIYK